jgi:hypothetical protein
MHPSACGHLRVMVQVGRAWRLHCAHPARLPQKSGRLSAKCLQHHRKYHRDNLSAPGLGRSEDGRRLTRRVPIESLMGSTQALSDYS